MKEIQLEDHVITVIGRGGKPTEQTEIREIELIFMASRYKPLQGPNKGFTYSDMLKYKRIDNATFEPAYTKLLGIQNISGSATTPLNVVILFDGTSGSIPDNWTELDGDGGTTDMSSSQVKVTKTSGEVGDTGGNNTHTHTSQNHTHTHADSHTHGGTYAWVNDYGYSTGGILLQASAIDAKHHFHTWTQSPTTPTQQANSFTTGSSDGRYNYRTVLFIKKTSEVSVAEQPAIFYGCNF